MCRVYLLLHGVAAQANDWGATIAFCCPPWFTEGRAAVLRVFFAMQVYQIYPTLSKSRLLPYQIYSNMISGMCGLDWPQSRHWCSDQYRQELNSQDRQMMNVLKEILPPNWRAIYVEQQAFHLWWWQWCLVEWMPRSHLHSFSHLDLGFGIQPETPC